MTKYILDIPDINPFFQTMVNVNLNQESASPYSGLLVRNANQYGALDGHDGHSFPYGCITYASPNKKLEKCSGEIF